MKPSPKTGAIQKKDALHRRLDQITREFRVICLREQFIEDVISPFDSCRELADYWRNFISKSPSFNPAIECLFTVILNTRFRPKGYVLISTGILDTILVHPREVFRAAIIAGAAKIAVIHNHPSGDPSPSEADIMVTRDLIRAGKILRIEVIDHLIMGRTRPKHPKDFSSLRELGYFYK